MSSRRTSLFSRRYAISRKAALTSLPEGRQSVRLDAEGFDDLDEYFSTPGTDNVSPLKKSSTSIIEKDEQHQAAIESSILLPVVKSPRTGHWHEAEIPVVGFDGSGNSNDDVNGDANDNVEINVNDNGNVNVDDEPTVSTQEHNEENLQPRPLENLIKAQKTYHKKSGAATRTTTPLATPHRPVNRKNEIQNQIEANNKESINIDSAKDASSTTAKRTPGRPPKSATRKEEKSSIKKSNTTDATSLKPVLTTGRTRRRSRLDYLVDVNKVMMGANEESNNNDAAIVRKSKRPRIPPLAFWKNEKVVYGRRLSTKMPVIVDVVRKKDVADGQHKASKTRTKRKGATGSRNRLTMVGGDNLIVSRGGPTVSNVEITVPVIDYETRQETDRLLALGPDGIKPATVKGENFSIQTVFTEGSFLSAGILEFPQGSHKPARNSSKHTLVFYVIEGIVTVTIHKTEFTIATGGQFLVPRGNPYAIHAAWDQTSRLFFCHCKDTLADS